MHKIWSVDYQKKNIKVVATRCHILTLKCTKLFVGWGSTHTLLGSLQRSLRSPSWILGGLLLRERTKEEGGEGTGEHSPCSAFTI